MSRARRSSTAALVCLTLFLGLMPLLLAKPGLPSRFRADEAGYYAMALSVWHDGDLRCEDEDLARIFQEFPTGAGTMMVMSHDDWSTVYFSKPFIYPLLVAPVVGALGANGLLSLNMLFLAAMIWMGVRYLERYNGETTAVLFAIGFFLLSPAFPYAFWIHPELFDMAAVAAAFFLVAVPRDAAKAPRLLLGLASADWRIVGSGAVLALGAFNKPLLAVMALPLVYLAGRRHGRRAVVSWLLAMIGTCAILLCASWLWTGQAWPYLGVSRRGVRVASPVRFVENRLVARGTPSQGGWMNDNPPQASVDRLVEDVQYFLWGRHVGVMPYMPFAVLCTVLFLTQGWRSRFRRLLLLALALAAIGLMISIPGNWHGGGDHIGNRYFVHLYPAFLFLVTRIRPSWVTPVGYAVSALLLGPILMTPFGPPIPHPGQSHVRQAPFRWLPLELSLMDWIRNYDWAEYPPGIRFLGRRDVFDVVGQEMWLLGASDLDLWMTSPQALDDAVFEVRSLAAGNRVLVCLQRDCRRLGGGGALDGPTGERLTLQPGRPDRTRRVDGSAQYVYRLRVSTSSGEQPRWRGGHDSDFYLGAAVTFLGTRELLEAFDAHWIDASMPTEVEGGGSMVASIRLENVGSQPWFAGGPAPVRASYHWLDEDGKPAVWDGLRTPLPGDVDPGSEVSLEIDIEAPERPGRYTLVIDLVREGVAWFGERGSPAGPRAVVEVSSVN